MALPKKGLRNITVNNIKYAWSVTGSENLGLSVIPLEQQGNLLTARFDYHSKVWGITVTKNYGTITHSKQSLIITAYVVRQVILYALNTGWNPLVKSPRLNLECMDDKIDLRLQQSSLEDPLIRYSND